MTDRGSYPSSIHPPLLPTPEDDWFLRLRLLRSRRVGISTFNRLLIEHGTAQNALDALPELARAAGVENYAPCPVAVIEAELKAGQTAGAILISQTAPDYPDALRDLADAPPFLWAIGDLSVLKRPMVSIVGARNASSLGTRMAKSLARDLADAGYVIVSGLARGIDAAAHMAALDTGTVAVQAGGVDMMYPAENTDLALAIPEHGLRLSEQPMGLQPMARHFPPRNRIVSGLGRATIVVEAAAKSGSLITARDGATLVRNAADVIEALSPMAPRTPVLPMDLPHTPPPQAPRDRRTLRETAALHSQILNRLGPAPLAEDQLIRDIAAAPSDVAPVLLELELDGHIERSPGGLLTRPN